MRGRTVTRDRIDQFEQAWVEAYPDLDPVPLRILGRVTRLAGILEEQGQALRSEFGVHLGEIQVLAALRRSLPDFTTSPKELAELTLVTSAAVTNRLNSLETKGLVSRRIDELSRRRILVTLTPAGVDLIEGYIRAFVERQSRITDELSASQRDEYISAMRHLLILVGDTADEESPALNVPGMDPL